MSDEPQKAIKEEAMPTSENAETLPENVSERTKKEFEKLKEHNKQLQEKLKEVQPEKKSVLEEVYPGAQPPVDTSQFPNLNKSQVDQIKSEISYKGEDGYTYVNPEKLDQALKDANSRATKAEQSVQVISDQVRRYEETQQIKETYSEFPELNPNGDKYDPKFFNLVRGELMSQAMKGQKDLMRAARDVKSVLDSYKGQSATVQKAQERTVQKEQINATGSAQPRSSYTAVDNDELVSATRAGKPGALAERLRRSGN